MGEPAGVGPELLLRAAENRSLLGEARLLLFGNPRVFADCAKRLKIPLPPVAEEGKTFHGEAALRPTEAAKKFSTPVEARLRHLRRRGAEAGAALDAAIGSVLRGEAAALVTAPIDKKTFHLAGYPAEGHTAYLQKACGAQRVMMVFVGEKGVPAVALLSVHVPLREAVHAVTSANLIRGLCFLHEEWKKLFGRAPRVAVAGLNPHAGEGGLLGSEEASVITPAIQAVRRHSICVEGPFAPDTVFPRAQREGFDAVLALYHDQGLIAVKSAGAFRSANLTLGLSFVRTSPDHGVAYDKAKKGTVETGGMETAVRWAAHLARRRSALHRSQ